MAYQSQTYSNGGHAYYITNENPVIPTDPTAIQTPLELLGLGRAGAAYYARILQTDATGLAIIEASTIQGPLMGITLNPNGRNGPVANAGPQIYAGFSSSQPNILLANNLTEVFGTLAIGTRLDQTDVNALKINYSATPYPNSLITQTSGGTNQLQVSLQAPLIGAPAVVVANPANATQTTTITGNSVTVKDTNFLQPSASLSFLGGQAAVNAKTGTAVTQLLTDSGGGSALEATNSLTLLVGYDTLNPRNVLVGNTDGTTNIPLKMYGPEVSTITSNSFIENTSTFITKTAGTGLLSVGDSGISDFTRNAPFNTGKLTWNTIKTTKGAPATASNSLEINNTAPDSTTGGIQFYCSNNTDIPNPKWMGGFQQSSTGPTSEFRLASTVQASMSQITNVSTINNQSILSFGNPVGTIISFAAWNPPAGYLRCDGSSILVSQYTNLYNIIGYTYGGTGPNFNLPDCLGKTMMGALTTYNQSPNLSAGYTANAVFQGGVSGISNPLGGVTTGLYFSSSDRPVTQGMLSGSQNLYVSPSYVVQYVVGGDGRLPGGNRGFLVMLQGDISAFGGLTQGQIITFTANPVTTIGQNYPKLGDQDPLSIGTGTMSMWQDTSQVGSHNHGVVATGSQNVCSSASGRSEPTFSTPQNAGIFSYTVPSFGGLPPIGLTAPRTMFSLPYNLGVTMCIKY